MKSKHSSKSIEEIIKSEYSSKSVEEIYTALDNGQANRNFSILRTVYFLCLAKPIIQQELSQAIYDGKIQLTRVNLAIDELESADYIHRQLFSREEMRRQRINPKSNLWQSSMKPVLKKILERYYVSQHKVVETKDVQIIEALLNSAWFKDNFLSGRFPELLLGRGTTLTGNINSFEGEITSMYYQFLQRSLNSTSPQQKAKDTSLDYPTLALQLAKGLGPYKSVVLYTTLADIVNVIGDIAAPKFCLPEQTKSFIDEKLGLHRQIIVNQGFDKYIMENKDKFSDKFNEAVEGIKKSAVDYLGDKEAIDFYFKDNASYLLPRNIAEILFHAGRISSIVYPIKDQSYKIFENSKDLQKYIKV
jgi:hypothetical protein